MSRLALSGLFNPVGAGPINLASGNRLSQTGMVVQTIWGRSDARTSYASPISGNGTTITDLNLTIVPKFSTSILLITWMINGEFSGAAWDAVFLIHKDGALVTTAGFEGYNSGGGNNRWSGFVAGQYDNNVDSTMENYRIQYWIPAGSTASQTFAPAVRSTNTTARNFLLNRTVGSTGADNYEVAISTGTIMEIAQ